MIYIKKRINLKGKGTAGERELIHAFWATEDWAAHRIAGSGSSKYPSPDIIASNNIRRLSIECKITSSSNLFLPKEEILSLKDFANRFGSEAWLAVKFSKDNKDWFFISLDDLKETEKSYSIKYDYAKSFGLLFEEFIRP